MYDYVTIIPIDQFISVNGEAYHFDFERDRKIHAIQWYKGKGHIEFAETMRNQQLSGEADYNLHVLPYVKQWEANKIQE